MTASITPRHLNEQPGFGVPVGDLRALDEALALGRAGIESGPETTP